MTWCYYWLNELNGSRAALISHSDTPKHFLTHVYWFWYLNLLLRILFHLLIQVFVCFKFKKISFKIKRIFTIQQTCYQYLSGRIYRYWSCSESSKLRFCTGFCREEHFIVPLSLLCWKDTATTTENILSFCEADSIHPLQVSDGHSVLFDLFLCSSFRG